MATACAIPLNLLWEEEAVVFGHLSYQEQQAIHQYFLPTCDLDLTELVAYRRYISQLEPSLPQRAGRAYERLSALLT